MLSVVVVVIAVTVTALPGPGELSYFLEYTSLLLRWSPLHFSLVLASTHNVSFVLSPRTSLLVWPSSIFFITRVERKDPVSLFKWTHGVPKIRGRMSIRVKGYDFFLLEIVLHL
jgi:hypothetical protein